MASIEENRRYWNEVYDWSAAGEEWSAGWGGTEQLWTGSLWPRLRRFLPAPTILELAPGYGRFAPYLMAQCERYLGVDLASQCVEACQAKFPEGTFAVNDGRSLPMVADASVDFVFSFFSLIHADPDTLESYLREFRRVLKPTGGGFIHHSNLGEHEPYFRRCERLPLPLRRALFSCGFLDLPQWRAPGVTLGGVAHLAQQAGLAIVTQEAVNFGSRRTIDAFTSFVRADGPWGAPGIVWRNGGFMHEAMRWRLRSRGTALPPLAYAPLDRPML